MEGLPSLIINRGGAVAKIYAEANGSGVIGAFDGKGRRLQPGP